MVNVYGRDVTFEYQRNLVYRVDAPRAACRALKEHAQYFPVLIVSSTRRLVNAVLDVHILQQINYYQVLIKPYYKLIVSDLLTMFHCYL